MNEIVPLQKKPQKASLPLQPCEDTVKRRPPVNQDTGPQHIPNLPVSDLGLPRPRTVKNKFLFFISHPVCNIPLGQPKQIKTISYPLHYDSTPLDSIAIHVLQIWGNINWQNLAIFFFLFVTILHQLHFVLYLCVQLRLQSDDRSRNNERWQEQVLRTASSSLQGSDLRATITNSSGKGRSVSSEREKGCSIDKEGFGGSRGSSFAFIRIFPYMAPYICIAEQEDIKGKRRNVRTHIGIARKV